jgi:hypothetical protein
MGGPCFQFYLKLTAYKIEIQKWRRKIVDIFSLTDIWTPVLYAACKHATNSAMPTPIRK